MSVVALPRTDERRRTDERHRRTATTSRTAKRRRHLSTPAKLWLIAGVTAFIVLAGNAYVAQRQVELHQLQSTLLTDQARYAARVSTYTNLAAPGRVAAEAGRLHLVEPSQVEQIAPVSLNVPLPLAKVAGSYIVSTRVYR